MKQFTLLLLLLQCLHSTAQDDAAIERAIDSLRRITHNSPDDSVRIEAYYVWDELIYISDPALDLEINQKVVEISERNILKANQSKDRLRFFYHSIAVSKNIIGLVMYDRGDYRTSQDMFHESLKIAEALQDTVAISGPTNNLGMIYKQQGKPDQGFKYYERAMKLDGDDDIWSKSIYLNNMGLCYADMGKYKLALNLYKESIELSIASDNFQNLATTTGNIGEVYYLQERYDSAVFYYEKSVKMNLEIENLNGYTHDLQRIGMNHLRLGHPNEAVEYCQRALDSLKGSSLLLNQQQCHDCLYHGHKQLKNDSKALYYMEMSAKLKEEISSDEINNDLLQEQYNFEYEKKRLADSLEISSQQRIKEVQLTAELESRRNKQIVSYVGIVILFLFGGFAFRSYKLKKRDNAIIEAQKSEVEIKNQEVLDSINYAKRIQEAILPPSKFLKQQIPSSFIYYQPKDIVAGDFYWLETMGDFSFIAVADCTGHGVPGAMVSVVCHNALNRSVREFKLTDAGEILDKTRELVIETFAKSETDVKDGMDIALCVWNQNTKQLQYAGANNSMYIISENNEKNKLKEIKADKQPIGAFSEAKNFTTHLIPLTSGDKIYLFTDGFADQFGGPAAKKYKYKTFKNLLVNTSNLDLLAQKVKIETEFIEWKGSLEQLDDVCVLGMCLS